MWQIYTVLVQALLLCSIAMIYFQSTMVVNLEPQNTMRQLGIRPPADRAVVFVTDGLRAKSFFRNNCSSVPDLQELFLHQGIVGIAHCGVPTMSRPGHIAIFGGFMEDPSVALYYFHKNPNNFDTVFNRSRAAYSCGDSYITQYFENLPTGGARLTFESFKNSDFSGAFEADDWVFNRVRNFLSKEKNVETVRQEETYVFASFLPNLDISGHNDKPDTERFRKILLSTQKGIRDTYELFERTFNDSRTVYLLTSDHGMSDTGAHGSAWRSHTEVPFFFWGAGVNREAPNNGANFTADNSGLQLPLHNLKQFELTSLMSAFIGLPPPMNNMGILPLGYMNVTAEYESHAAYLNALQLLAQVTSVLSHHETGYFSKWLPRFNDLDFRRIEKYKKQIQRHLSMGWFTEAMEQSHHLAKLAVKCLEFYENYYRKALIVTTVFLYLGWFYIIFAKQAHITSKLQKRFFTKSTVALCALGLTLAQLMILQQVPCWTTLFLILPIPIWILAVRESPIKEFFVLTPLMQVFWLVSTAGILIGFIRDSRFIMGAFLMTRYAYNRQGFCHPSFKFVIWLIMTALISGFIPYFYYYYSEIDFNNEYLVYCSMVLVLLRPLILWHRHAKCFWISNTGILALEVYGIYLRTTKQPFPEPLHCIFWAYILFALISIPFSNTKSAEDRLELICFNLCTVYTLFSTFLESIFIQLMAAEHLMGFHVHADLQRLKRKKANDANEDDEEEEADSNNDNDTTVKPMSPLEHLNRSYYYSGLFLLYTFLSFYGNGHHAYMNWIDTNTARLFVTNFSFVIISLTIAMKLLIGPIIVMSIMYAMSAYVRQNLCRILLCLTLICNVLSFCFFFFVQNRGDMRQVRFSITTLIVAHGCVLILMVCSFIAKLLFSGIPMTIILWDNESIIESQTGESQV
ncbi:uncharacterized protein Dwil_GK17926 [Drosophila willistoni]|uniref:GPI ethanolamine phosphate transferase 1 n=1 Tax=Drosophila willistoni TaxID=7260 RepID=A0A0Q9WSJ2_DROWI|nr:GPI ethanolamine phosphate transferase 1 [Drosophila willistoni]KRF99099.1 uncharacterized protein Dwil_GK17926 [Drosophila willistoni]